MSAPDTTGKPDHWNADRYEANVRFVSDLGMPVVELLAPKPGERILDLGCGDGPLTRVLAEAGAEVVGVDASPDMIAAAKAMGLDAHVVDGHDLAAWAAEQAPFDAVFSNAALHWMTRPADVFAGVAKALKPGGRFVAEQGGHGNVAAVAVALQAAMEKRGASYDLRSIWSFPTPEEQRARLVDAGFDVRSMELIPRPTPVPAGLAGWLDTFAPPILAALPEGERAAARADAVRLCAPSLQDLAGNWSVDYVRLRFSAVLGAPA
ncbi:class I SAM-dependent methyltransferase [Rhodovulum sp. DZ06]|uniref:class I SAM-dependent methyltransferase n=1 Tax=Rhodovulum sp. DZ06 TaxID=3425126 RepID=UPI003D34FBB6